MKVVFPQNKVGYKIAIKKNLPPSAFAFVMCFLWLK